MAHTVSLGNVAPFDQCPSTMSIREHAAHIAAAVADYRRDDGLRITSEHVLEWAEQFDPADQAILLAEFAQIIPSRYITKEDGYKFIRAVLAALAKDAKSSIRQTLQETCFLDLQEDGKSQKALLAMLDEILAEEYGTSRADCTGDIKRYVYLDDVLCTGNTLFHDITQWLDEEVAEGVPRFDQVNGKAEVQFAYLIMHRRNFDKVCWRFHYWNRRFKYSMRRGLVVDNEFEDPKSKLDFIFPIREGQPQVVLDYFAGLDAAEQGVFRPRNKPATEEFFTSTGNRIQVENALLLAGLEILDSVAVKKENIRPLGFTLPSHKNLGFGTVCFTWRNVPNNVPLAFWYSCKNWNPLFEKRAVETPLPADWWFG